MKHGVVSWGHPALPNSNGSPSAGALNTYEGGKYLQFSMEIAVYLGNGMRYATKR